MNRTTATLAGLVLALSTPAAADNEDAIGYPSVQAAYDTVQTLPGAELKVKDGWSVITLRDGDSFELWTFTPPDHPAHPTAVRRRLFEEGGAVMMQMNALCESSKVECDRLVEEFRQLNEDLRRAFGGAP